MASKWMEALRIVAMILIGGMVLLPIPYGLGAAFIGIMFCDSGPSSECVEFGLMAIGVALSMSLLSVPALLSIGFGKIRLRPYLYLYPVILVVMGGVLHWSQLRPLADSLVVGCLLTAGVTSAYLIVPRVSRGSNA